ncbi:VOC family protein [Brevibacterium moorei]|uniref:VOC family protein n=1 Tax=Brevibacterium moorei TaxID=2968457 RepID=UPI00211CF4E7|nr:VOC family protein [Brevibacterium sp. 68QC2CO]MCQ9385761.1 VOC family protein [Brevibacterium sp. 68QC2CO]
MTKLADRYDPGPQIAQCGTINLGTKDLEKSLSFFRDTLGMEEVERVGNVSYLRCYMELGHHSLVLTEQDENIVNSYSFRVARPQDVELFAAELAAQEIEAIEVPAGTESGRGTAVRFQVPGSLHPFELYYDIDKPLAPEAIRSKLPSNSSRRRGLGVRRIDHYNVQAEPGKINQAESWVRDTLGFKRREFAMLPEHPTTVMASWMSVTSQVHDLAMVANQSELNTQLHHVAFNLENFSDALTAADVLADLDVKIGVGPGKHGIGQAMYLYVFDPGSGHRVELYSGGYQIFDPDWQALEWDPVDFPEGMTWYGDPIDLKPGSNGRMTTGSAGLVLPGR